MTIPLSLSPVYSLYAGGAPGSFMHGLLERLSRRIGFATILFWGRFCKSACVCVCMCVYIYMCVYDYIECIRAV